jgi:hypothetical protein
LVNTGIAVLLKRTFFIYAALVIGAHVWMAALEHENV